MSAASLMLRASSSWRMKKGGVQEMKLRQLAFFYDIFVCSLGLKNRTIINVWKEMISSLPIDDQREYRRSVMDPYSLDILTEPTPEPEPYTYNSDDDRDPNEIVAQPQKEQTQSSSKNQDPYQFDESDSDSD